jgi:hypothetical protein
MLRVRQQFPRPAPIDIPCTLATEFGKLKGSIRPGARIAVGVGSRGIANLATIVRSVVDLLRSVGAVPFLIPAMGSHGGATAEGQIGVLAEYGVTEASMGVPIRASMEVQQVGTTEDGVVVWCSTEALKADGILVINRIKPHTDFFGDLGSGLFKMCVIGIGKHAGALAMHRAASRVGHERVIRSMGRVLLATTPILGGIGILENQHHDTARLVAVPAAELEAAEDGLLKQARDWMPRIPFEEVDLLILDRIGKNISGAGMDPNVVGRSVQGYSSSLMREGRPAPFIRRIFVRGLTPETHGNAIGIGLADVTTTRLVQEIDHKATYINALTALTHQCAKIPIHFETDREAIERMLQTLAIDDTTQARIVRISDTLSPGDMEISEPLAAELGRFPQIEILQEAAAVQFDPHGNLGTSF